MAYVSQERKKALSPKIKEICKRHKVKVSIAVHHHSTLVLNVKSGTIDFIGNINKVCGDQPRYNEHTWQPVTTHISVNPYWYQDHFDGAALAFLSEIIPAMNVGNHDHSDIQTDYFNVGWYVDVNIGKWDAPYALVK
jgi:hypothetical protein